jgi:hypothetical protein
MTQEADRTVAGEVSWGSYSWIPLEACKHPRLPPPGYGNPEYASLPTGAAEAVVKYREASLQGLEAQGVRYVLVPDDIVKTVESWSLSTLPGHPEWIVAIRLDPAGPGHLVPSELRVFPFDGRHEEFDRGEWSGDPDAIPAGGLPVRALRSIALREHAAAAQQELLRRATSSEQAEEVRDWLERLPASASPELWRRALGVATNPEHRSPIRTDEYLGAISILYAESTRQNPRRANAAVASITGLSATQIRDAVHAARQKGFLTPTTAGRSGGEATERAREVVLAD